MCVGVGLSVCGGGVSVSVGVVCTGKAEGIVGPGWRPRMSYRWVGGDGSGRICLPHVQASCLPGKLKGLHTASSLARHRFQTLIMVQICSACPQRKPGTSDQGSHRPVSGAPLSMIA